MAPRIRPARQTDAATHRSNVHGRAVVTGCVGEAAPTLILLEVQSGLGFNAAAQQRTGPHGPTTAMRRGPVRWR